MKTIKKILALALALVMVLGISSVAFADGTALAGGTAAATDLKTDGITMKVEYKPEAGLKAPAKTFSYTVTVPADDDLTTSPKIYKGLGSITIADVAWNVNEATEVTSTQTKTVAIPLSTVGPFTHAGIYRYYITQAPFSADEVNAGILTEKGTGDAVQKYLDLVVDKDGKITSAVLSDTGAHEGFNYTTGNKADGFANTFGKTGTTDPDGPGHPENSGKHTITLSKVVAGNAADTSEAFPFRVEVSSVNTVLTGVQYSIGTKTDAEIGTAYDELVKLKDGETINIVVPNDVKVEIKELTAATEGYSIKSEQTGFDDATVQSTGALTDAGFKGTLNNANDAPTVTYTNTRDDISFTGVALKVAPFVMILAAGCLMLVIGKRRKESEEA